MGRLRSALQQRYKDREEEIKIHTPQNCETLNLTFRGERVAKASSISYLLLLILNTKCSLGYWHFSCQPTETWLRSFRAACIQRLLIYPLRPSRSEGLRGSFDMYCHAEAEGHPWRRLGARTMAS